MSTSPASDPNQHSNAASPDAKLPAQPDAAPAAQKPTWRVVLLVVVLGIAGITLILRAWEIWPFTSAVVTTDDSYVRGQITVMAPQVNGYIAEVGVADYQHVKGGQVLFRIDDRIYRQHVDQAQADLNVTIANLDNIQQTMRQNDATLEQRRGDLYSVEAERDRAKADELRVDELSSRGSVAIRQRDQVRATARASEANVYKANAAIRIAQETIRSSEVQRKGLAAQVDSAKAKLALAKIDLANTVIVAPEDGQVSEASVRRGQYVSAGSQLIFLVPDQIWVVANFKETQTHAMYVGQRVSMAVDALDGQHVTGTVEVISPATGSEFSVLRPDNASGNFTKVVQRIPVRIKLDRDQPLRNRLRPGMSVVTSVDTSSSSTKENPR